METKEILLEVSELSVRFNKLFVLENINFTLYKNDFVAISGPNGGGKTTFLRVLLGLQKSTEGKCQYYDQGHAVKDINMGYLPQRSEIDYKFPITVREVIESGLIDKKSWYKHLTTQEKQYVGEWIELLGMQKLEHCPIGQLSGGQLQRTLLGRALVSSPDILVLDEPSSYLDKRFEASLYELLKEISSQTTVLMVSHELGRVASLANRIVYIDKSMREEFQGFQPQ